MNAEDRILELLGSQDGREILEGVLDYLRTPSSGGMREFAGVPVDRIVYCAGHRVTTPPPPGTPIPPVELTRYMMCGVEIYGVGGGNHRVEAAAKAGRKTIDAWVDEGRLRDDIRIIEAHGKDGTKYVLERPSASRLIKTERIGMPAQIAEEVKSLGLVRVEREFPWQKEEPDLER